MSDLTGQAAAYSNPDYQPIPPVREVGGYGQVPQPVPTVQVDVRQSRDRAQYVRQQKGHSLTLHLLLGGFVLWIPAIYFTCSPNHYWHA